MSLLSLAWLSFLRRRVGLLLITPPTAVLFGLLAVSLAAERGMAFTRIDDFDRRVIRVGAYEPEMWFTPAQVAQMAKLPSVVSAGTQSPVDCRTEESGTEKPGYCLATSVSYLKIWRDQILVPNEEYARWETLKDGFIVTKKLAERHHWRVGQQITLLRARAGSTGPPVTGVITFIAEEGLGFASAIYVHPRYADEFDRERANRWVVWLMVDDPSHRDALMKSLPGHFPGTPMELSTMEHTKKFLRSTTSLLVMLFRGMALLALVLLSVVALTIVTLSIDERRQEFATLRAIGARRAQVTRWILFESILLLMPGALLGSAAALATFGQGIQINTLSLRVTWDIAARLVLLGVVIGGTAAIVPSVRAGSRILETLRGV